MTTFRERLEELLIAINTTAADMARDTGMAKSSLSQYRSGKRIPKESQIRKIADTYNVDIRWLMGYDVPMRSRAELSDIFGPPAVIKDCLADEALAVKLIAYAEGLLEGKR